MRLNSLYIKGFKSFANETKLVFNDDVIGIVGPNGSGKSNIVDAIRWVLGEQKSRELRLEQMSDVIFNGTKTRKESPTAMVELTFDNDKNIVGSEYNTISISRTLYRSGESEYRLNNVQCRLKDITSLFLDTGIGSNSYAIIALGMVDDILADKDHARRRMFEQASGISKYKKRKKETLQKLQNTGADLNRVQDLIFEIEGNMKSLEKQARRTKKYFEIKKEYKELSIKIAARSVRSLKEEFQNIEKKVADAQGQYTELQARVNGLESSLEQDKKHQLDKESSLSDKQKELNEIISSLRSAENERDLLMQRMELKSAGIKALLVTLAKDEEELNQLENDAKTLQSKVEAESVLEKSLEQEVSVCRSRFETLRQQQTAIRSEEEAKNQQLKSLENVRFDLEKSVAVASNQIEGLKRENIRLQEQIKSTSEEIARAKSLKEDMEVNLNQKQKAIDRIREEEASRKEKRAELELHREGIQSEINELNRTLDSRQNEYDLLKSMVENLEGFPESIRFLSNKWEGKFPILSDLLDVDEAYKSVVEQYLENYLNYFVVENLSEANEAIKLLRGSQKGKANFFITSELPEVGLTPRTDDKFIPAVDVVRVDLAYQGLLNFLLKDAFIYNGELEELLIEQASALPGSLLSAKGTFIKSRASVSGGSVGLFEGKKIGRKKNLERLKSAISKLEDKKVAALQRLEKFNEQIRQYKETDNDRKAEDLLKEYNHINQEHVRLETLLENARSIKAQKEMEAAQQLQSMEDLQQQIEQQTKEGEAINARWKALADTRSGHSEDAESIDDQARKASEEYNTKNIQLIRQQGLVQNFQKELEYKRSRAIQIGEKLAADRIRMQEDEEEIARSEKRLIEIKNALIERYESRDAFQGDVSEFERSFFESRNAISEKEEVLKQHIRKLNQAQVEINELKDQFNDIRFKITSVGDRLKIEFNIDIKTVLEYEFDEAEDLELIEARAEKIKSRLENYGEINPLALEAYEEIKKRYDHILEQKNDIEEAKTSLLETIKEIESTATVQFMDAFSKVRENFKMVFRSLFTEDDNCDLILLNEEDPLESDIEIIAKPKGKKPKSLSQLSGGEKTLTATALLFALYLLKPAPFCIFDEVDAPLDDANIQKFNKIIKKFSGESQFIIVTHNKATMSAVDVLYGVYMQEMGVSGVTPVDFRSLKAESFAGNLN